jgi:hypothetical protein
MYNPRERFEKLNPGRKTEQFAHVDYVLYLEEQNKQLLDALQRIYKISDIFDHERFSDDLDPIHIIAEETIKSITGKKPEEL